MKNEHMGGEGEKKSNITQSVCHIAVEVGGKEDDEVGAGGSA